MVAIKLAFGVFVTVCIPLKHLVVTSCFGYRVHPITGKYAFHNGVDLRAQQDTVYAMLNGVVTASVYHPKIGLHLCIAHGGIESVYGHLSQVFVSARDSVFAGQPIGITGVTGQVTGEHLHFAIRFRGRYTDPLQFLYQSLIKEEHEKEL